MMYYSVITVLTFAIITPSAFANPLQGIEEQIDMCEHISKVVAAIETAHQNGASKATTRTAIKASPKLTIDDEQLDAFLDTSWTTKIMPHPDAKKTIIRIVKSTSFAGCITTVFDRSHD